MSKHLTLEQIHQHLSDPKQTLERAAMDALNQVISREAVMIKIAAIVELKRKINTIEKTIGALTDVETVLLAPERIRQMNDKDLIALFKSLTSRVDRSQDALIRMVSGPQVDVEAQSEGLHRVAEDSRRMEVLEATTAGVTDAVFKRLGRVSEYVAATSSGLVAEPPVLE